MGPQMFQFAFGHVASLQSFHPFFSAYNLSGCVRQQPKQGDPDLPLPSRLGQLLWGNVSRSAKKRSPSSGSWVFLWVSSCRLFRTYCLSCWRTPSKFCGVFLFPHGKSVNRQQGITFICMQLQEDKFVQSWETAIWLNLQAVSLKYDVLFYMF